MSDCSGDKQGTHHSGGVLIVEDEALVACYLEDTLDVLGHKCCGIASTAEEAVSLAEKQCPTLALVDIGLRGSRDGITVASELTRLGITIVFLTGSNDAETRRRAEAVRPHGLVSKPCNEQEIAQMLESAHSATKRGSYS